MVLPPTGASAGAARRVLPGYQWGCSRGSGVGGAVQRVAAAAYSGVRPVIVVIFVHDLESSVRFYSGLLAMEVTASDDQAAVLGNADAAQLHLRRVGPGSVLPVGDLDRRYVVWTATDDKDLRRCARFLQASSAPVRVLTRDGITFVEGQDPSGRPVTINYPGLDHIARRRIWRIDDY